MPVTPTQNASAIATAVTDRLRLPVPGVLQPGLPFKLSSLIQIHYESLALQACFTASTSHTTSNTLQVLEVTVAELLPLCNFPSAAVLVVLLVLLVLVGLVVVTV